MDSLIGQSALISGLRSKGFQTQAGDRAPEQIYSQSSSLTNL